MCGYRIGPIHSIASRRPYSYNFFQRKKMDMGAKVWFGIAAILVFAAGCYWVEGSPIVGICIRNCAQCKKMFGPYFEGQLCADTCVKYKAKIIPDCEDITSIAPFLNRFD